MKIKSYIRILAIGAVLLANVGCDQITKKVVRANIDQYANISLIDNNILTLTKVENTGAFLSLGNSLPDPMKMILLILLPVAALLAGLIYVIVNKNLTRLTILGITFCIGGGIGNIYDRILYGSVTDFLHIDLGIVQTGIFNMADVSVMVGMGLILLDSYFEKKRTSGALPAEQEAN